MAEDERVEVPRDGGGMLTLRIFRLHEAGDRRDQRPGRRRGHHDDAADGHPPRRADGAKIGFVFARRGIVPEACSSWFLPRLVGISQAMEWVATGRVFTAEEALAGGLVRSVHAADELLPRRARARGRDRRQRGARCRWRWRGG